MRPAYCSVGDVVDASDTGYRTMPVRQIMAAILSASRSIDNLCDRRVWPEINTKKRYRWNPAFESKSNRLFMGDQFLWRLESVTSDGESIPTTDVVALPVNTGPPFTRLELTENVFSAADAEAVSVEIIGDWGASLDIEPVTTVASDAAVDADTVHLTGTQAVSVGSVLVVGSEWLIVSDQQFTATTSATVGALADKASVNTINVTDGSLFEPGERAALGGEIIEIRRVVGNVLHVARAVDGSKIEAHPDATTIWKPSFYTIQRGALGSEAASLTSGDPVNVWRPPATIRQLAIAETLQALQLNNRAWQKPAKGGAEMDAIEKLRHKVRTEFRAAARIGAV